VLAERTVVALNPYQSNNVMTSVHRPETIIGKALEPLAGGEGAIFVLSSSQ